MADQLDLSQLSDEQLDAYKTLLTREAFKKAVDPLRGGTPPGPATPAMPIGLSKQGASKLFDADPASALIDQNPIENLLYGSNSNPKDPRMAPWKVTDNPNDPNAQAAQQGRRFENTKDLSQLIGSKIAAGGASVATGMPWWLTGINAATAQSPADAATVLAGGALFPALNKLKAASRGANTVLGAAKGAAGYEGLSRFHDALTGDPQRPLNPLQGSSPVLDSLGLGLSALAGGAQGHIEVPNKPSPFQLANKNYQDFLNSKAELNTSHEALNAAHSTAQEDLLTTKQATEQAERRLSSHEAQMDAAAKNAKGSAQKRFQTQQAALRAQEKALQFQTEDAKAGVQQASDEANKFQKTLAGGQQFSTGKSAEEISDQILAEQKRLDDLRNPAKAPDLVGTHPDAKKIQAEIDRLNNIDTSKYNEGAKKQVADAVERNQNALTDLNDGNIRNEVDASKNRIRVLQDYRRRVEAGRAPGFPPAENDIAQAQEEAGRQNDALNALRGKQNDAQQALADINAKYRDVALARLQHAATAPGATVSDQAAVETHQKLLDSAEKARAAKQAAELRKAQIETQKSQVKEQIARLTEAAQKGGYAATPSQDTADKVLSYLKKGTKAALLPTAGAFLGGGHDSTSLMTLGPAIGSGLGIAADALLSSPSGRQALQFVNSKVSPNASKLNPALVNQLSHMKK